MFHVYTNKHHGAFKTGISILILRYKCLLGKELRVKAGQTNLPSTQDIQILTKYAKRLI